MSEKRLAKLIYEQWKSDLANKDRSSKNMYNNFDELFYSLHMSDIGFDVAHDYLKEAVHAHAPTKFVSKRVYDGLRGRIDKSFEEFCSDWKEHIKDTATQAFFTWFSIEGETKEERQYGNMSPREYSLQRKDVERFPHVDLMDILRQQEELLAEDFEDLEVPDGKHP